MSDLPVGWLGGALTPDANPSFSDLVRRIDGGLLPRVTSADAMPVVPHGTTILALRFADGVVVAGDRRATEGMYIADRRIEKVFPADAWSAVAIAGAAGPAIDMVKLFQTELEHYEKVEGDLLSLEGKANKLAQMIKANFPMALQGLVVVPLYAGYDAARGHGRIFRYDVVGGRYEDTDYHATGSGGLHARGTLKKGWRSDHPQEAAVRLALEALADASDEDAATGGADLSRQIFPTVAVVTARGYESVPDEALKPLVEALLAERREGGA